jgi:hypothetical protein
VASWRGYGNLEKREKEFQVRIYDILRSLIHDKKFRFHGVSFSDVKAFLGIDGREADLAILGPGPNDIFLIIETKRKEARLPALVIDKAYIGQALSYAALAKRGGYNVYFIGVSNPDAIAIYRVPEDVEKIVNWDAIERRKYDEVIPPDRLPDFFDQDKYAVFTKELELSEEFFQKLIDELVLVWRRGLRPVQIQPFTYKVIEDFRGFVNWLSQHIEPLVRKSYDALLEKHKEQIERIGYKPAPEHLAREMSYVLMNKILFYKVLEKTWGKLPRLDKLYDGKKIDTAKKYIDALYGFFEEAIEKTGKFWTNIYNGYLR